MNPSIDINKRFFEALEKLINSKKIDNLSAFCKENYLSRPKYAEMKRNFGIYSNPNAKESRYKYVGLDAINALVSKYNISCDWLLLGEGEIFKK